MALSSFAMADRLSGSLMSPLRSVLLSPGRRDVNAGLTQLLFSSYVMAMFLRSAKRSLAAAGLQPEERSPFYHFDSVSALLPPKMPTSAPSCPARKDHLYLPSRSPLPPPTPTQDPPRLPRIAEQNPPTQRLHRCHASLSASLCQMRSLWCPKSRV